MPLRPDLLEPIAGESPGGVDLRYDPIYDQIKEARRQEDDLPQGEWVRTRKVAEWPLVEKLAGEALATRSKDLQLAVWLLEAQVHREGAAGLRHGLTLLAELLDRFWDHCFPAVEDGDLELRAAPLEWVASNKFQLVLRQHLALNRAGHSLLTHVEGRKLGTEESVAGDSAKRAAREEAIEGGKVPPEELDAQLTATPKPFFQGARRRPRRPARHHRASRCRGPRALWRRRGAELSDVARHGRGAHDHGPRSARPEARTGARSAGGGARLRRRGARWCVRCGG